VPVLVIHSKDDQIVPYEDSGHSHAKLLKNGVLKDLRRPSARVRVDASRSHQCWICSPSFGGEEFGADKEESPTLIVEPVPANAE
jgi:hypothetical protein